MNETRLAILVAAMWIITLAAMRLRGTEPEFRPEPCAHMCASYDRGVYAYNPTTGACTCSTGTIER